MDDWEVTKSAEAICQTFDSTGPRAHYRTALVLRQDAARPIIVEGHKPSFALFLIEVGRGSRDRPNSLELQSHEDRGDAVREAVHWLGSDRAVSADKVPATVLAGVANVMRDPAMLSKYAT